MITVPNHEHIYKYLLNTALPQKYEDGPIYKAFTTLYSCERLYNALNAQLAEYGAGFPQPEDIVRTMRNFVLEGNEYYESVSELANNYDGRLVSSDAADKVKDDIQKISDRYDDLYRPYDWYIDVVRRLKDIFSDFSKYKKTFTDTDVNYPDVFHKRRSWLDILTHKILALITNAAGTVGLRTASVRSLEHDIEFYYKKWNL